MIISFKIFENENKSVSFIPNDLIPYFEHITDIVMYPWIGDDIKDFLYHLLFNKNVKFECEKCLELDKRYGAETTKHKNRNHKGLVRGFGCGFDYNDKIYLTLHLNRIKYQHVVNVNKPITIYGDIPNELMKIIEGTNMLSNTNKYNI